MFTFTTSNLDLTTTPRCGSLLGFIITAGASASTVNLRSGSLTGQIVIQVKIPAAGTTRFAADRPILFPKGIYVEPDANVSRGTLQPG